MAKLFVCKICGEPYIGGEAPDDCPFCGAPKNYIKDISEYKELWKTELTDQEKQDIEATLKLEVNATAYYTDISKTNEKFSKMNRLYKQLARVEKEHAEVAAKFLGVELPEFSGEKTKGSPEKDLERTKELESHAVELYQQFMDRTTSANVKNFFAALIHAEKGHGEIVEKELE